MERLRNLNRHTIKYNRKVINEFVKVTEEYSDLCTHRLYGEHIEYIENMQALNQVKTEALTLPVYLQKDLCVDPDIYDKPEHYGFFDRYYPQMVRFMPKRMAENWVVVQAGRYFLKMQPSANNKFDEDY